MLKGVKQITEKVVGFLPTVVLSLVLLMGAVFPLSASLAAAAQGITVVSPPQWRLGHSKEALCRRYCE